MACFIAHLLPPWDAECHVVSYAPSPHNYRTWMHRISGDYVAPEKVTWLREWMRAAKPGDMVYLNEDHESVPKDRADVAIYCKPV